MGRERNARQRCSSHARRAYRSAALIGLLTLVLLTTFNQGAAFLTVPARASSFLLATAAAWMLALPSAHAEYTGVNDVPLGIGGGRGGTGGNLGEGVKREIIVDRTNKAAKKAPPPDVEVDIGKGDKVIIADVEDPAMSSAMEIQKYPKLEGIGKIIVKNGKNVRVAKARWGGDGGIDIMADGRNNAPVLLNPDYYGKYMPGGLFVIAPPKIDAFPVIPALVVFALFMGSLSSLAPQPPIETYVEECELAMRNSGGGNAAVKDPDAV